MPTFTIMPFDGASPIKFGMTRSIVHHLLGIPRISGPISESWGPKLEINIGYGEDGTVNHLGFSPGELELRIDDVIIWLPDTDSDPNSVFLAIDENPLERLGFLVFTNIGVATTGYHEEDPSQHAVTVFPKGAWDSKLAKAIIPDLQKYKSV